MLHDVRSRCFLFSIELRRNLAETRQRKKATAQAVALFHTFSRRNHVSNPFRLTTSRLILRLLNS
ncbi:hypothetical protein E2R52_21435 [Pantoea ananatis]|nr:hypothetical protein EPK90_00505 [Pantoea ananatis]QDP12966.1 hypothetical protein B9Q16_23955 [Pantoea ananatis]RQN05700.1 hypothetical protein EHQ51_12950 [Pantoea ananatis]TDL48718.1 hypothetical protein E2R52_21435 [Pantoea ananatis]HCN03114.1 hypothetical protein [Pantoea ananatis]